MHVGDEEVEATVSVEVERLHPHRAPGGPGKVPPRGVAKPLAAFVEPEVVLPLHVEDVEVGPTVVVHVDHRRVAAPASIDEPDLPGDIPEPAAAQVVVQN